MQTRLIRQLSVSAASGLVHVNDRFYAIADDEHHLISFTEDPSSPIEEIKLFDGELPQEHKERKKLKPDLESLVYVPQMHALLAVPSGSKPNRCRGALFFLQSGEVLPIDFSELYSALEKNFDLNIEGAIFFGGRVKLFQRGNSARRGNSVINLDIDIFVDGLRAGRVTENCLKNSVNCDLGEHKGVPLGFTDAAVSDSKAHFIAVSEKTDSTYDDREFAGAVIGRLNDLDQPEIGDEIICSAKPEGLCGFRGQMYLVTDADDRNTFSGLYHLQP